MTWRIEVGDCRDRLRELADESVHCVVTSPPYFGLRDYRTGEWDGGDPECDHLAPLPGGTAASGLANYDNGLNGATIAQRVDRQRQQYRGRCARCGAIRVDRQIGLEPTPDEFVEAIVGVFREVRRVLRRDGTVWLNLGDSYASKARGSDAGWAKSRLTNPGTVQKAQAASLRSTGERHRGKSSGVKEKDLLGMPWLVAFALRADGWYLRSEIVWTKPNPMPESVYDRPTSAHEKVFLLTKAPRYFYDADAIREANMTADRKGPRASLPGGSSSAYSLENGHASASTAGLPLNPAGRNRRNVWEVPEDLWSQFVVWLAEQPAEVRDVWEIATVPYAEAHFATFPVKLVEPCVLAGSSPHVCSSCGAPWQRVVKGRESTWPERKAAGATWGNVENAAANGGTQRVVHGQGVSRDLTPGPAETVGWEPTCAHEGQGKGGRSVVLDPFAGSGTVGVVCEWFGRDFVGIELNESYAQMARDRVAAEGRLGRRAYRPEPIAQAALF